MHQLQNVRAASFRTHLRQAVLVPVSAHWRLNQMRQVDVFHGVIMALFAFSYAFTN